MGDDKLDGGDDIGRGGRGEQGRQRRKEITLEEDEVREKCEYEEDGK